MKKKMGIFFIVSLLFCLAPLSIHATSDTNAVSHFEKISENVTAYTASKYKANGQLRYTASSKLPQSGYVAMKAATVRSSTPFGTIVTTPRYIKNYDGIELKNYFVQDTGVDPKLTTFAVDIWWGFCRTNAYLSSDTRLGCSTNDGAYSSALTWGEPLMKLGFVTPP